MNKTSLDAKAAETNLANVSKGQQFISRIFKPNWTPSDVNFCKLIWQQVHKMMPEMERGMHYTLEDIYGSEAWSKFNKSEVIKAGMYMSHMVKTNQLPLKSGKPKGVTKTYQLI